MPEDLTDQPASMSTTRASARGGFGRGTVAAIVALGVLLVAGALYLIGYLKATDVAPRNATVAGIAIGGLNSQRATDKLRTQLGPVATAPITLNRESRNATIDPVAAGLTVDYPATIVAAGVGRSASPVHVFRVLAGGGPADPVVRVDEKAAEQAVAAQVAIFAAEPKDASLAIDGVTVKLTPAVVGAVLDVKKSTTAVVKGWQDAVAAGQPAAPVPAHVATSMPAITDDEARQVAHDLEKTLKPITARTDKGEFIITAEHIAAATTISAANGSISAATDVAKLFEAAGPAMDTIPMSRPKNASFTFEGGKPKVVPSHDGESITAENFTAAVQPVLAATGDRAITVPIVQTAATLSTAQAEALGIKEITGEFTTYWQQHTPYRNTNLGTASRRINGTLLKPGEIFSYNKVLGERTAANGYVEGGVLSGGRITDQFGGSVSQGATTTYNAAFFAGLKDVEHHPHGLYYDRYPAGREATVSWGELDLRFQNDTPHGVLMQAFVNPSTPSRTGSITVRVWSTKVYDVKSSALVRSNYTTGSSRIITGDPLCKPQPAAAGFDVDFSRLFYKGGALVKTEKYFWRYRAADAITCQP